MRLPWLQAVTRVNTEQASKCRCGSRLALITRKAVVVGEVSETRIRRFHRGNGGSMQRIDRLCNKGSPRWCPSGNRATTIP